MNLPSSKLSSVVVSNRSSSIFLRFLVLKSSAGKWGIVAGGPGRPGTPGGPGRPGLPSGPGTPLGPSGPSCPDSPAGPRSPFSPGGPVGPCNLVQSFHKHHALCFIACYRR